MYKRFNRCVHISLPLAEVMRKLRKPAHHHALIAEVKMLGSGANDTQPAKANNRFGRAA